jgi:hypothetical protein
MVDGLWEKGNQACVQSASGLSFSPSDGQTLQEMDSPDRATP